MSFTVGQFVKVTPVVTAGSKDPRTQNGGYGVVEAVSVTGNTVFVNFLDNSAVYKCEMSIVADATGTTGVTKAHTHERKSASNQD